MILISHHQLSAIYSHVFHIEVQKVSEENVEMKDSLQMIVIQLNVNQKFVITKF